MEPEGDEASTQHPKRSKHTQFPSTSSKDSILGNPTLPQELITAILVRLPVKYLLQFKCVSKDWFGLISSPDFVKTHLSFSAKNCTRHRFLFTLEKCSPFERNLKHCSVSSLFYESVTESFDLDYPMKDPKKSVRIVGSVNGLICYRIGFNNGLVLWNPSTRKFKQVPDLIHTQTDVCLFNYGFGYDEVHDDYKAVGFFGKISNGYVDAKIYAKIYSLKSDSWRIVDDFQGGVLLLFRDSKLVNGKLHWDTTGGDGWGIMFIDLVDEKCGKVEQPCYGEGHLYSKLGVLGSDLSVICNYYYQRKYQADVWIMKEYGVKESWTKLYTIKYPSYALSPPVCMSNEGELLFVFGSTLMIYNSKDDLMRYPEVTNVDGNLEAELYVESLVSPILQNEHNIEGCKSSGE